MTTLTCMRYSRRRPMTALLLVGLIALPPATVSQAAPAQTGEQRPVSSYDGEAIFRGLYFGQGPVADLFPEIWKQQRYLDRKKLLTPEDERRMEEVRERIITSLREKDKAFFDRLATTLKGGNHLAIQKALGEATEVTLAVLQKETGRDPTAPIVDAAQGVFRYVQIWQVLYFYWYVYVYEFFFLFLYVSGAQGVGPLEGAATMKGVTRLQREQWTDLIAKRLGKPSP